MRKWIEEAIRLKMPYFGHDDTYFLGTGAVGVSGTGRGKITFAIGPDYTSPNFLESQYFFLSCGTYEGRVRFEMTRLRGCGVFFGMANVGGMRATVTDVCMPKWAKVLRLLTFENQTDDEIRFTLGADIVPSGSARGAGDSVEITKDAGEWCFGNQETKNWAQRNLKISMPDSKSVRYGKGWRLKRKLAVPAEGMATAALWYDFGYEGRYEPEMEPKEYLDRSVAAWRKWLSEGEYPANIKDMRLKDAVECLLLNVKMQQNRDGGMIAGIRKYANSYIRDTHGGMRLLNICGHLDETKKLLLNVHTRWEKAGYIPNWWSMGSDTFIGSSFHNDAAEITAYYLFMARDYLKYGGDRAVVEEIMPSLRWAADSQAQHMRTHDGLMDFNGDETEQYCVFQDGQEYGLFGPGSKNLLRFDMAAASFASTAAAVESLDFFAELCEENRYHIIAGETRKKMETAFWKQAAGRHGWIRDANGLRGTYLTNYSLLPLWLGVKLEEGREKQDALAAVADRNEMTGYLPNCPGVMDGFCGHTLGMALYDMVKMENDLADELAQTILHSNLLGRYGTVSEFYGPGGTPNGHNARPFEGGIVGEALVAYAKWREK